MIPREDITRTASFSMSRNTSAPKERILTRADKARLLIYLRWPESGKVKTRIAKTIGNAEACALYKRLAEHTLSTVRQLSENWAPLVLGTGAAPEWFGEWIGGDIEIAVQTEGDLGRKLIQGFTDAFDAGYPCAVAIGGDCPELALLQYDKALAALREHAVVIGPALDNGYYLVGCRHDVHLPLLFDDMPWGEETLLEETLLRLRRFDVAYHLLPTLRDVDHEADARALGWI